MDLEIYSIDYRHFLNRSTVIYGESGSGKSVAIVDILYNLKDHVGQIIVFSPTDRQNNTYGAGTVPLPFIHYDVQEKLLNELYARQEALSMVWQRTNKRETIEALYGKCSDKGQADEAIEQVDKVLAKHSSSGKKEDIAARCDELRTNIMKHVIEQNRDNLTTSHLSEDEAYSLKYLHINPRIVIIFDDCTDSIKRLKKSAVMQKIFYQGRWLNITTIIACHSDQALDPELRRNAYVSMFMAAPVASVYFERASSGFDSATRKLVADYIKAAFTPVAKYQKLVWVRTIGKYYKYTADVHEGFRFGSDLLWEYANKVKNNGTQVVVNNRFIRNFT